MTTSTDGLVERLARKLCEQQIRNARRWDTDPTELEAMLPNAIDYAWLGFRPTAEALLPIILEAQAARIAELEGALEFVAEAIVLLDNGHGIADDVRYSFVERAGGYYRTALRGDGGTQP